MNHRGKLHTVTKKYRVRFCTRILFVNHVLYVGRFSFFFRLWCYRGGVHLSHGPTVKIFCCGQTLSLHPERTCHLWWGTLLAWSVLVPHQSFNFWHNQNWDFTQNLALRSCQTSPMSGKISNPQFTEHAIGACWSLRSYRISLFDTIMYLFVSIRRALHKSEEC
jgi:hypothetical protein